MIISNPREKKPMAKNKKNESIFVTIPYSGFRSQSSKTQATTTQMIRIKARFPQQHDIRRFSIQSYKELQDGLDTILSSFKVVHRNIVCDSCETHPLIGNRYKCTKRKDYDLCQECYNGLKDKEKENDEENNNNNTKFTCFKIPAHLEDKIQVKYLDDENDWVVIETEKDYEEALLFYGGHVMNIKVLRPVKLSCHPFGRLLKRFSVFGNYHIKQQEQQLEPQQKEDHKKENISKSIDTDENIKEAEEHIFKNEDFIEIVREKPIEVEEEKIEDVKEEIVQEDDEKKDKEKYAHQLKLLNEMGFKDVILNKHLLNNFEGEISKVIASFLKMQIVD